jgi:hypothetical protein
MGVIAAGAMGAMALGSGIMGALGSASQADAAAQAAEIQQRNANFQNQWAKATQDRNVMREFQANLQRSTQIEKGAATERALAEYYLDKSFSNQKSTLSKQTSQVNAQFISSMTSRGITASSGTARAMLRQNIEALGSNMVALKLNHRSAYQDIITQQQTRLGQRGNAFAPDLGVFIPSKGGIANNSSTALTTGLIQAGLSGASVGIQAGIQYTTKPGTTPSSGGSFMPFAGRLGLPNG